MALINESNKKISVKAINIISIVIPLVVAVLLGIRTKPNLGEWTKILPHLNALINSTTSILLILGFYLVKNNKLEAHRKVMTAAFSFGGAFLIGYVIYHLTNPSTTFGGKAPLSYFYYFILISHIALSLIVLPLVLRAIFYAWNQDFIKHKKMVRFAWPIWLYVSITGVIAYLLISPYYSS